MLLEIGTQKTWTDEWCLGLLAELNSETLNYLAGIDSLLNSLDVDGNLSTLQKQAALALQYKASLLEAFWKYQVALAEISQNGLPSPIESPKSKGGLETSEGMVDSQQDQSQMEQTQGECDTE